VVDQARERFRVKLREFFMLALVKLLEVDLEVDRAAAHHVLDLEAGEFDLSVDGGPDLLRVLLRSFFTLLFSFCAGDDHLARFENESGGPRLLDSHDDGGESLGVVLAVAAC